MAETVEYTDYEQTHNSSYVEVSQRPEMLAILPFTLGTVAMSETKFLPNPHSGAEASDYEFILLPEGPFEAPSQYDWQQYTPEQIDVAV